MSDPRPKYNWFLARNVHGQARLMHATVHAGDRETICGVYVGEWSRYHLTYIAGFACQKCAVKAGLIQQPKRLRKSTQRNHLRSVS